MKRLDTFVVLLLLTAPSLAQEKAKEITLRWYGHACYQLITPNGKKIVFDPHNIEAYGPDKPEADLVLISHEHNDHSQPDVGVAKFAEKKPKVLRGLKATAGIGKFDWNAIDEKWEGYRVRTFGTYHDEADGAKRGKNSMFILEIDGITICHCGDLGHEFTEKQVKSIGPVDVLLIPVGGIFTVNGRTAVDVVDQIKPKLYAVPMHFGVPNYTDLTTAEEFFDTMKTNKKPLMDLKDKSELVIPVTAKAEGYSVVQMSWVQRPKEKD